MEVPSFPRFLAFALCFFLACTAVFAQKNSRESNPTPAKCPFALPVAQMAKLSANPTTQSDCSNDQVPPEIACLNSGGCAPGARAAYVVCESNEPWGQLDNLLAMEAAFGNGNWDYFNFESADPSFLISTNYKAIFLEGSDVCDYALMAFLSANLPLLEAWVADGGALFVNSAPNYVGIPIDFGFGGVTLLPNGFSYDGVAQFPAHPVFNSPFLPADGPYWGDYFSHGFVTGPVDNVVIANISGSDAILAEKYWGNGKVYFGGMTMPYFHQPYDNAQNMRQNILADLKNFCQPGATLEADAGECFATVTDASLDVSATDDCALASLTHDFGAAPSNTSMKGAQLPVGYTIVVWTATDASGNSSTCSARLWVRENEAPTIKCPDNMSVVAEPAICVATPSLTAEVSDNCDAAPKLVFSPSAASGYGFGTTVVTATAVDHSGNKSSCTFEVEVSPSPEICNGIDDNCDGWVDEDVTDENTFYLDADGDGYGDPGQSVTALGCTPPWGYVANALDCDDSNWYINPGAFEYCDGLDNNCDGQIDEGNSYTWYADADGDGYGDPYSTVQSCYQPQGYVSNNWDCNDNDSYINPGAMEDCTNDVDENCDGILGDNNFVINVVSKTDLKCHNVLDGAIQISVTPAQNYPIIRWSNGICCTTELSGLSAGTYKVTVTNECGTTKTQTIVIAPPQNPPLELSLSGTDLLCNGDFDGTVTAVSAGGCGGSEYLWSHNGETQPNLSGLAGGYYSLTVTDQCGCSIEAVHYVHEPEPLQAYFAYILPLLDGTYFVFVNPYGGTPAYQFRFGALGSNFGAWGNSNGFFGLQPGDYVFEVSDQNGCSTTLTLNLPPTSPRPLDGEGGEDEVQNTALPILAERAATSVEPNKLSVLPNPNNGLFEARWERELHGTAQICVTDESGKLALRQPIPANALHETVQGAQLPAGLYFLQLIADGRVIAVERFVKQ